MSVLFRTLPEMNLIKLNQIFESLSFEEKKQALIALVDKNKLYVNYTDMNDQTLMLLRKIRDLQVIL